MDVDKVDRRCCDHKVEIGCSIDTILNNIILILILLLDTNMHNSVLPTLLRECLNQNLILSLRRQVWPDDSDHGDGKFFKF